MQVDASRCMRLAQVNQPSLNNSCVREHGRHPAHLPPLRVHGGLIRCCLHAAQVLLRSCQQAGLALLLLAARHKRGGALCQPARRFGCLLLQRGRAGGAASRWLLLGSRVRGHSRQLPAAAAQHAQQALAPAGAAQGLAQQLGWCEPCASRQQGLQAGEQGGRRSWLTGRLGGSATCGCGCAWCHVWGGCCPRLLAMHHGCTRLLSSGGCLATCTGSLACTAAPATAGTAGTVALRNGPKLLRCGRLPDADWRGAATTKAASPAASEAGGSQRRCCSGSKAVRASAGAAATCCPAAHAAAAGQAAVLAPEAASNAAHTAGRPRLWAPPVAAVRELPCLAPSHAACKLLLLLLLLLLRGREGLLPIATRRVAILLQKLRRHGRRQALYAAAAKPACSVGQQSNTSPGSRATPLHAHC